MKNFVYKIVPAFLLVLFFTSTSFSGCGSNKEIKFPIAINNANATIIAGCFDFEAADTFSIQLDAYPQEVIDVYPATPIPDSLRIDGLRVEVSGTILESKLGNQCYAAPNVKLVPANKFEITIFKKIN